MTTRCGRSTQGADWGTGDGRMAVGYRDGTRNVAIIPVIGWLSDDRDRTDACMVDHNINISDRLCMTGVCIKGIIAGIDSVKVNEVVKQDVEPQSVGEIGEIGPNDEVVF